MTTTVASEPSSYMQTLTRYLLNIMNSTLLGLPREIKELIYFDALSHAADRILVRLPNTETRYSMLIQMQQALPLSPEVKYINANGVIALAKDVEHLTSFVDSLENGAMLKENLDELQQTVNLLQSDNHDEFFDMSTRNKKYGRVDAMNGPILLEKYSVPRMASGKTGSMLTCTLLWLDSHQRLKAQAEPRLWPISPHALA